MSASGIHPRRSRPQPTLERGTCAHLRWVSLGNTYARHPWYRIPVHPHILASTSAPIPRYAQKFMSMHPNIHRCMAVQRRSSGEALGLKL